MVTWVKYLSATESTFSKGCIVSHPNAFEPMGPGDFEIFNFIVSGPFASYKVHEGPLALALNLLSYYFDQAGNNNDLYAEDVLSTQCANTPSPATSGRPALEGSLDISLTPLHQTAGSSKGLEATAINDYVCSAIEVAAVPTSPPMPVTSACLRVAAPLMSLEHAVSAPKVSALTSPAILYFDATHGEATWTETFTEFTVVTGIPLREQIYLTHDEPDVDAEDNNDEQIPSSLEHPIHATTKFPAQQTTGLVKRKRVSSSEGASSSMSRDPGEASAKKRKAAGSSFSVTLPQPPQASRRHGLPEDPKQLDKGKEAIFHHEYQNLPMTSRHRPGGIVRCGHKFRFLSAGTSNNAESDCCRTDL